MKNQNDGMTDMEFNFLIEFQLQNLAVYNGALMNEDERNTVGKKIVCCSHRVLKLFMQFYCPIYKRLRRNASSSVKKCV